MAAGKIDLTVFLEGVGAEDYTQRLLDHGVVTLDDLATVTQDKLKEWNIDSPFFLPSAITKARQLVRSSDAVIQEELLVSDTNLILEKKDWGLSISVGQAKGIGRQTTTVKGWDVPVLQLDVFFAALCVYTHGVLCVWSHLFVCACPKTKKHPFTCLPVKMSLQKGHILLTHPLYMSPEMFARSIELYREHYSPHCY